MTDASRASDALSVQMLAFAADLAAWPERLLDNGAWAWDDYVQVRYAPLHAALALRGLAGHLHAVRAAEGKPLTLAQHALADHHAAFRDLQALLLGLSDEAEGEIDTPPAAGEWPIRTIVAHVHDTERYFLATILNALDGGPAEELSPEQIAARTGEPVTVLCAGTLTELWAAYARVHGKVQAWLAFLSDAEVETLAAMWESTPYPVLFRMQRFAAHLREHTNQVEKALRALDRAPSEGQMLARQLLAALAEVEGLRIGMGDLGQAVCDGVAQELALRLANLPAMRLDVEQMTAAVAAGDVAQVQALLAQNPNLAYTRMNDGVSALLSALYMGRGDVVEALKASGVRMTLHEASALGELARARKILGWGAGGINDVGSDGYTPLQLAGHFGRTEVVRVLLAHGADVNAVAQNSLGVQALHAAVAGRSLEAARVLIEAGANVNAQQAGGYTPLSMAEQNGDTDLADLLRAAGATG